MSALADLTDSATGRKIPAGGEPAKPQSPAKDLTPKKTALRDRSGDLLIIGFGIALAMICALFPWYIFFNQDQFGVRAMQFGGARADAAATGDISPQPDRVGQPMTVEDLSGELDLISTGTLPDPHEDAPPAPGIEDQPFPADIPPFKLVHVANGRAMIEDDDGLWVVKVGSILPDNSHVTAIERRDGKWVLVTSDDIVVALSP